MKALQLSLNGLTEEQREVVLNLAEVLKGSLLQSADEGDYGELMAWDGKQVLTQHHKSIGFSFIYSGNDILDIPHVLRLPLDTLKVCPWLAMKHGVSVSGMHNVCWPEPDGGAGEALIEFSGQITKIEEDNGGFDIEASRAVQGPEDWDEEIVYFNTDEPITLSLSQFEDNKVAGISIVEVG